MKAILLLLAVAVVATFVTGQHRCSAPSQLTFRGTQYSWGGGGYKRYFGQYDRYNERVVLFEEDYRNGTETQSRKYIFLHREHMGYDVDMKNKRCTHFKIGDFRPIEVPRNATFEIEVLVGGPEEELIVDQWIDKIPGRRETWIGQFSLRTCYPVSQFLVEDEKFNSTTLVYYYDAVVGLVNPNDFTIPAECRMKPNAVRDIPLHARMAKSLYSGSLHL